MITRPVRYAEYSAFQSQGWWLAGPVVLRVVCRGGSSAKLVGRSHARWWLRCANMAGSFFDGVERVQLCDLLEELGPQAPTLLDPWTTHDMAAHLVLREHDLVAAPGLVVPGVWGRFAERRQLALKQTGFGDLIATIRSGPPPGFFRIGWVRRVPSLNEFFVHHEDVRRANGLRPRLHPAAEAAALFRNVARAGWLLSRRLHGAGLELVWGRKGPGSHSAARASDRSAAWAIRRTAPVPVRSAKRSRRRDHRPTRGHRRPTAHAVRDVNRTVAAAPRVATHCQQRRCSRSPSQAA